MNEHRRIMTLCRVNFTIAHQWNKQTQALAMIHDHHIFVINNSNSKNNKKTANNLQLVDKEDNSHI